MARRVGVESTTFFIPSFREGWDLNRDNETSVTRPTRPQFDLSYKPGLFNLITKATTKFSNRLQNRRRSFRIDYKADEGILQLLLMSDDGIRVL